MRECSSVLDDPMKEKFRNALLKRVTSKAEITAFLDTLKTIDNVDGRDWYTASEVDIYLELMSVYNAVLRAQLQSFPCFPVVNGGIFLSAVTHQRQSECNSLYLAQLEFPDKTPYVHLKIA